jgi:hypothetical protein
MTNRKTTIACIGTMQSMVDFSSLCINMDTIIIAICSNDEPQPILRQIILNFVAIVNNPDWVRWSDNVGSMPALVLLQFPQANLQLLCQLCH